MMTPSTPWFLRVAAAVILSLGWMPVRARAESPPVAVEAGDLVQIVTRSGSVRVRRGPDSQIRVIRPDEDEFNLSRLSKRVLVKTRSDSLLLEVPEGLRLDIQSRSGDVRVEVESEHLEIQTVSGEVRIRAAAKSAAVETISGDVELEADVNRLRLSAISGDIEVRGKVEEVRLRTTSGDVDLLGHQLPEIMEMKTVSGDLVAHGELPKGAAYRMESMSGSFELERSNDQGFRLEAQTRSGDIHLPKGERSKGRDDDDESGMGWSAKREWRVVGEGGAELRFESFSGDISIR